MDKKFYWIQHLWHPTCGSACETTREQVATKEVKSAKRFYTNRVGEPGEWTLHYKKHPCDISHTPITSLISQKTKQVFETMEINARYRKVAIFVNGTETDSDFFFPEVCERVEFIDVQSDGVKVNGPESRAPGRIHYDRMKAKVFYSLLKQHHLVTHPYAVGRPWIVSSEFKRVVEDNGLTNFSFIKAEYSDR